MYNREELDPVEQDERDEILRQIDHAFDEPPPPKPWEKPTEHKPATTPERER